MSVILLLLKYLTLSLIFLSPQTERDVSVRQRAADLLYAMCDRSNAKQIVAEMLSYLETADYSIREEMVGARTVFNLLFFPSMYVIHIQEIHIRIHVAVIILLEIDQPHNSDHLLETVTKNKLTSKH